MSKLEEVKKEIAKYDYVRFSLCDLNSEYRGQVVAGRHAAKYLEEGIDIAQGNPTSFTGSDSQLGSKDKQHLARDNAQFKG